MKSFAILVLIGVCQILIYLEIETPGGGGHSGTEGGRTLGTYFAEEGVFFEDLRMSAIL